jgi:hypothetical protein
MPRVNLARSYISLAGSNFSPTGVAPTVAAGGTSRTVYSFYTTGGGVALATSMAPVLSLSLPAGSYWIPAKTWLSSPSNSSNAVQCQIDNDSASYDTSFIQTGTTASYVTLLAQDAITLDTTSTVSLKLQLHGLRCHDLREQRSNDRFSVTSILQ